VFFGVISIDHINDCHHVYKRLKEGKNDFIYLTTYTEMVRIPHSQRHRCVQNPMLETQPRVCTKRLSKTSSPDTLAASSTRTHQGGTRRASERALAHAGHPAEQHHAALDTKSLR
jgi:hypothetical protein